MTLNQFCGSHEQLQSFKRAMERKNKAALDQNVFDWAELYETWKSK